MRRRFVGGAVVFVLVLASVVALVVGLAVTLLGGDGDGRGPGPLLGLVVVLALLVRVTLRWARPTARVIGAADRLAAGDLTARADVTRGPRTVRRLGRSFDAMADELARQDDRRRQLLADVAHELRTPLTVVRGNVEGIVDGVYAADAARLGHVLDELGRAERLLDDLRTLSNAEAGQLTLDREDVALDRLVARVVGAFEPRADALGVVLVVDAAARPVVHADPDRLEQVVSNLVANALRHGEGASRVTVTVDAGADVATITVHDDGPGLPPALVERVFDRFVTGGDRGGTGLGLPIVRRLAELHGGSASLASDGTGTTVTVALPLERGTDGAPG